MAVSIISRLYLSGTSFQLYLCLRAPFWLYPFRLTYWSCWYLSTDSFSVLPVPGSIQFRCYWGSVSVVSVPAIISFCWIYRDPLSVVSILYWYWTQDLPAVVSVKILFRSYSTYVLCLMLRHLYIHDKELDYYRYQINSVANKEIPKDSMQDSEFISKLAQKD